MHRQEDRQNEMMRSTERLHSLLVMEKVLDEEIERLENECDWNCRKYVYLQALECDPTHLNHLSLTMRRSQGLSSVLRVLLEETFQERLAVMNKLMEQQQNWKNEDECTHYHTLIDFQHQQTQQHMLYKSSAYNYLEQGRSNHNCLPSKETKKYSLSIKKISRLRKHFVSLGKLEKSFTNMRKKRKARKNFNKKSVCLARLTFSKSVHGNKRKVKLSKFVQSQRKEIGMPGSGKQILQEKRGLQNFSNYKLDVLNSTNEMSHTAQINIQSFGWLHPSASNQQIKFENFMPVVSDSMRNEDTRNEDLFYCTNGASCCHELVFIGRDE